MEFESFLTSTVVKAKSGCPAEEVDGTFSSTDLCMEAEFAFCEKLACLPRAFSTAAIAMSPPIVADDGSRVSAASRVSVELNSEA